MNTYRKGKRPKRDKVAGAGSAASVPKVFTDASRGIRLQKALADAGVASRRQCEELILAGQVRVNGRLVTGMPAWVDPVKDKISVDGKPMRRTVRGLSSDRKVYVMLNKPRRVITTAQDPQGRRTVIDMIDLPDAPRLFPVGRLDADSSGLILLTNDGDLAQQLTHPSYEVTKEYHVSIKGRLTDEDVEVLKRGLFLASPRRKKATSAAAGGAKRASMQQVKRLGYSRGKTGNERTRLAVTLAEGQNREIRRMMARLGFNVRRLERVAIGPVRLKGLGSGQWRLLTGREVGMLKRAGKPPRTRDSGDRTRRPAAAGRPRTTGTGKR